MKASAATKAKRLPLIRKRVGARKKAQQMREAWERRRAEQRAFLEETEDDETETAGSPDELPDFL